jgi:hypothetical protein
LKKKKKKKKKKKIKKPTNIDSTQQIGKKTTTHTLIGNRSSPIRQHNVIQKTHTTQGERGKKFLSITLKFPSISPRHPTPRKRKKNVCGYGNTERQEN